MVRFMQSGDRRYDNIHLAGDRYEMVVHLHKIPYAGVFIRMAAPGNGWTLRTCTCGAMNWPRLVRNLPPIWPGRSGPVTEIPALAFTAPSNIVVTIFATEPALIASATMVMERPKAAPIVSEPVIHAAPVVPLPSDVAALQRRVAEQEIRILELKRDLKAARDMVAFYRQQRGE